MMLIINTILHLVNQDDRFRLRCDTQQYPDDAINPTRYIRQRYLYVPIFEGCINDRSTRNNFNCKVINPIVFSRKYFYELLSILGTA